MIESSSSVNQLKNQAQAGLINELEQAQIDLSFEPFVNGYVH